MLLSMTTTLNTEKERILNLLQSTLDSLKQQFEVVEDATQKFTGERITYKFIRISVNLYCFHSSGV